jgi:hypothetical protein
MTITSMPTIVQLPVPVVRRLPETGAVRQAAHDYQRLRLLALGIEPSDVRARAMVELGRSDAPSRVRDLEAILREEAAPPRLRHLAALLLGQIDSDSARRALRTALEAGGPRRLIGTVAQSLGRIGDRVAFEAQVKASQLLTGVPLAQARFALQLIAHRHDHLDRPGPPQEEPELVPLPGEGACNFELRPANPIEAQLALRSLASEPFGVELDEPTAHVIRCERSHSVLFLNRHIAAVPDVRYLLVSKSFAGLVARRSEATGLYSTSLIVLTTPNADGNGMGVSVYQPNGTLVLAGGAALLGEGLAFALRSVMRRGAFAAHVEGSLERGAISLTVARTGCSLRDVGRPAAGSRSSVPAHGPSGR